MKWNERYFDELGTAPGTVAQLTAAAEQVAAVARAAAPVDTGAYRDSIQVETHVAGHRVVAEVIASSDHAMIVEAQTGTMARALGAVKRG